MTVGIDEFKFYLRDQVNVDDALIEGALEGARISVLDFVQREVTLATGTPTSRVFTPPMAGMDRLRIPDCVSITSITDNGTTVTDYQAEPLNNRAPTGEWRPYDTIRRFDSSWTYDGGRALVTIVADWGWLTVPQSFDEALKIVGKDILLQRNNNSGVAGFGEFGAVRVQSNKIASALLQPLAAVEAFGVA